MAMTLTFICLFSLMILMLKRSVGKLPLVGLIRLVLNDLSKFLKQSLYLITTSKCPCFCYSFVAFISNLYLLSYLSDSKCLGCVYVQREAKSPDFKGVSGMDAYKEREILKIFC